MILFTNKSKVRILRADIYMWTQIVLSNLQSKRVIVSQAMIFQDKDSF